MDFFKNQPFNGIKSMDIMGYIYIYIYKEHKMIYEIV